MHCVLKCVKSGARPARPRSPVAGSSLTRNLAQSGYFQAPNRDVFERGSDTRRAAFGGTYTSSALSGTGGTCDASAEGDSISSPLVRSRQ